ncbi:TonB-dependent receptor [Ferruginibacter paludis]|uniref:TonB-dependent receptor n=1 Tax=Ferruginibacter paludis TaxID=1310417 RepID=UPI0025B355F5|nr:TonB-dependent receptor [Ferruginibacter paludis]MDN3658726.1 TonB-dependent receptor [Ferruginibacter paludis]
MPVHSQNISGVVKDAQTQQALSFCSIQIMQTGVGTSTDVNGKFKLPIPQNMTAVELAISSSGYFSDTITISPTGKHMEVFMTPLSGTLNEVVVTSASKATLAKENPVAITSVSSKAIENGAETNIIDVLVKNVPGLNAVKTGPNISKPFIRGLGYNRVLVLYDGLRQEGQQWGDEHGIETDAYSIGKAEVVKGPASIMYGSDAVAGVVSLIPETPANKDENLQGKYYVEYQHNNGLISNGLKLSWSKNHWGYIMRGSFKMAKNYTNSIDKRIYNTGFRETNASVIVQHYSDKGYSNVSLTLYNNLQGVPDGSRDSATRKFTRQIYEGSNDDIKNRPVVSETTLNGYMPSPLHQHIQHYRLYSNNHYELGSGNIDILLGLQQNIRREYNHPTLPEQAGMYVRLNTFNYSLRYNAPALLNTEISFGVNGMYQNNKSKDATDFPIPDYRLLDAGIYLYGKWKQKKWTISGGVRYDNRHLKGAPFYTGVNNLTGFNKHIYSPDTAGAYLQFPQFNKSFTGTSLSIGATYQANEHVSIKANVARGYRAPSITEFASNGLDPGAHIIYLGNSNFIPEFSLQEDIGTAFSFKDVTANVSLFNNNIAHYIYLSQLTDENANPVLDAQGNKAFQYQQAAAQLYGMELNLNLHPSGFKAFSFDNALSMVYGFNKKRAYKSKGINGAYLPLIPPLKILSSLIQNINMESKILKDINAKIEAEFNAAQNRFLALNNTETPTPSYTLFNLSVSTKIVLTVTSILQFQLQVNNLFDKAYQSNLSRLKYFEYYESPPDGRSGIYGMGRNICLKASWSFK